MAEPTRQFSAGWITEQLDGELHGPAKLRLSGVAAIDEAADGEITFIADAAHAKKWGASRAAACVVTRGLQIADHHSQHRAVIYVANAELALLRLLEWFSPPPVLPEPGAHPTAFVHSTAQIGTDVRIGPHVSVDRDARIGAGSVLHAGVRVYAETVIGDGCELHANVVIRERCRLGRRVILHQGVSIGGDGFGYRPSSDKRGLLKMPHIGNVVIEDEVEIGSNSCVDRGKFRATLIGAGSKIDNLVQIAHNCRIGRSCVIAGQTGLAGSVVVGDGVLIGAQAGVAEGVTIGPGAKIAAKSGVMRDVPAGMVVMGLPAEEGKEALRQAAAVRKLPDLIKRLGGLKE